VVDVYTRERGRGRRKSKEREESKCGRENGGEINSEVVKRGWEGDGMRELGTVKSE
jgi:hypothetical protein